ncbi:MAG TPA: 1,4-alpha-glucan branching protein GlgB [Patescibacteria group bacterium]|nr:1,4-alpha-glucan branching protein GlgB [Patescibacteria group bacterium]
MNSQFLTHDDLRQFNAGRNFHLYEKLGAHPVENGVHFAVWAPNARSVAAIGDFNGWDNKAHPLEPLGSSGVWAGIVHEAKAGQIYKYHVASNHNGYEVDNADPVGFCTETPPRTGSVIWDIDYEWHDRKWMQERAKNQALNRPMSIYEVHLGSWMRVPEDHNRPLSYEELADKLVDYVTKTGFTHVEFMPVMEYPFGGSWGYQVTGFFAPTRRYGDPQALMYLIDRMHQAGIGVILDWVPSHFPADEHGLAYFDGTHLYEHADPRQGYHPDWNSNIFNYGRNEVRSFLISSALFWLDKYHADGLRVDAVASMLYLDYSRKDGEWVPNRFGGRENLEALEFVRDLNKAAYAAFPGVQMIAEESTAWPMVSRPVYVGGLGFGLKWDMGWMHDTLKYFALDPVHRRYHHNDITFRSVYAFHENFVLSLSHDECVHGKGAMIAKMAGDDAQKFANLRCLYTYMYSQPGKKLLFMGDEIAQWSEWNHDGSLDWHLLQYDRHRQIHKLVTDLNHLYRKEHALQLDCDPQGFEWIDGNDQENSVLSYLRQSGDEIILCIFNFTPVPRKDYRVGVPKSGQWQEIFNSDASVYGGSAVACTAIIQAESKSAHNQPFSVTLNLPPLAGVFLKWKQNT